jgi:molybdopterin-guanine dinucleotide biosynthesis protein A
MDRSLIEGLILCGGQAQRMGGQDKGLIQLKQRPLFEHCIERLAPQVGALMLNANRNQDRYVLSKLPVYADIHLDFSGPLAGFYVGLSQCKAPYLAIVPCDSPVFPLDLVERLFIDLQASHADVSYAVTKNAQDQQQNQSVFCLIRNGLKDHLSHFLDQGDRKIDRWFHQLNYAEVLFPNESAFANINTPEELLKMEGLLS